MPYTSTRRPSFLIIGAMKAGTTSLFQWLGAHPDVYVPRIKEPNFFSDDRKWMRGSRWYEDLFANAEPGQLAGEASVRYTDPARSAVAATRIARSLPDVRLLFVVRDPAERLRSHYRHEVQRGRERRSLRESLADDRSRYLARSMYFACLEPYIARFPRGSLCIVRFEELFGQEDTAWSTVLAFLHLTPRPRPSAHLNSSARRDQFSPALRLLWDAGVRRPPRLAPSRLRRALRPLLLRRQPSPLLSTAEEPLPGSVTDALEDDQRQLERWMEATEKFAHPSHPSAQEPGRQPH